MEIFQTTPPPQINLAQVFFVSGSVAGIVALSITLIKFYFDYIKGSDIKLIIEKQYEFEIPLNNVTSSLTIPLIFVNDGNKTGVVTEIKLDNNKPSWVEKETLTTRTVLPLAIEKRDCSNTYLSFEWTLGQQWRTQITQTPSITISLNRRILWKRTHPIGRFFKKIEIEKEFREKEIELLVSSFERQE